MQNQTDLSSTEPHAAIKLGIDALALCQRLDRYTRGNLKAFSIVRVPTEDEERERGLQNEAKIPRGVGPLTFEVLRREVGDWARFTNRCQVSSYTGLCPRESSRGTEARWTEQSGARRVPERAERGHQFSSGGKRKTGSVSKSGNPRVRAMLVEMVWRMMN